MGIGIKRFFWRNIFKLAQPLGIHILPKHYYSTIPDTSKLPISLWEKEYSMSGIDMNMKHQINMLEKIFPKYASEFNFPDESNEPTKFSFNNAPYVSYDAEVLHSIIREYKPKKIFEIGSGATTLISANACHMNTNGGGVIAHEPFPNETLKNYSIPGLLKLDTRKAEEIPVNYFQQLEANDILFIDSTHVIRVGGDVLHLYLEVLPILKSGVLIHIHDILFPKEYFKDWILNEHHFWNEMYLLQAFLAFNSDFEILWCGSYMHCKYDRAKLKKVFPRYNPSTHFPGSIWLRRK